MFRMTPHGHRFSNGGLTDSQLPLDVPGGSPDLGYLRRVPVGHNPPTRVKKLAMDHCQGEIEEVRRAKLILTLSHVVYRRHIHTQKFP